MTETKKSQQDIDAETNAAGYEASLRYWGNLEDLATESARILGRMGGKARALKLSKARRVEIATKASLAAKKARNRKKKTAGRHRVAKVLPEPERL